MNHKEAVLDETRNTFLTQPNTTEFACLFALPLSGSMFVNRQDASGRASVQGRVQQLLAIIHQKIVGAPCQSFLDISLAGFLRCTAHPGQQVYLRNLFKSNLSSATLQPPFVGEDSVPGRDLVAEQVVKSVLAIPHVAHTAPLLLVLVVLSAPDGQCHFSRK